VPPAPSPQIYGYYIFCRWYQPAQDQHTLRPHTSSAKSLLVAFCTWLEPLFKCLQPFVHLPGILLSWGAISSHSHRLKCTLLLPSSWCRICCSLMLLCLSSKFQHSFVIGVAPTSQHESSGACIPATSSLLMATHPVQASAWCCLGNPAQS
jgi:hypothetical protein